MKDVHKFEDNKALKQYIVCAAIRNRKTKEIILGVRHFDSHMRNQISISNWNWSGSEQGFVDNFGNFLTREEARAVAIEQNQIRRRCGGDEKKLFSENLY